MRQGAVKEEHPGQAGGTSTFAWGQAACEELPSRPRQADNGSCVHLGVREALSFGRAGCGGPCPKLLGKEGFRCRRAVCVCVCVRVWPVAPVCLSQCAHAGLVHLRKVCLSRPVAWASFVSGMCVWLAARATRCFGCVGVCHVLACLPLPVEHLRDQALCRGKTWGHP